RGPSRKQSNFWSVSARNFRTNASRAEFSAVKRLTSKQRLSRRQFLEASAAAAMAMGSGPDTLSGQAPSQVTTQAAVSEPEVLILLNGRIHTMNARNTVASTLTIRNGRFAAVGTTKPARTPGARVIDLKGRTVIPGIVEA